MYTLVLVDMQPYFAAANSNRVRSFCKKEIVRAMERRASIIFVEFENCGPSVKSLTKLVEGYDRFHTVIKNDDDGSIEVYDAIHQNKMASKKLRVCGVNTDCCVRSTVSGLSARMPNATISVIADACNSDWNHQSGLNEMRRLPNVTIKE